MSKMAVELFNMDCMEYMRDLKDNAFDLAIVDPPYGIAEKLFKGGPNTTNFHKLYQSNKWVDAKPKKQYFEELQRVTNEQIICGGNYFCSMLPESRGWIVWDKCVDGFSSINNELIWTSFDKAVKTIRRNHGMDKGFMSKSYQIHPTQKPIALYKWILENYAKPRQRILDTHLGSGSSAIAAHYFGCDFVGCEIDEDYYGAAVKRFDQETRQMALI